MIINDGAQEQRDLDSFHFFLLQHLVFGSFPNMSTQQVREQQIHSV